MAKPKKNDNSQSILEYAQNLVEFGKWGMKTNNVLQNRAKAKRYQRGDHPVKHRDSRLGNKVWNKFAQISRNRLAHIAAQKPKWRFNPVREEAIYMAEGFSNLLNDILWNKIKWEKKSKQSVIEARDTGTSHIKIFIRNDGFPDAIPLCANEIVVDPKAKKKEHLRFWAHIYPMTLKEIERKYGKMVEADADLERVVPSPNADRSYTELGQNKQPTATWKGASFKHGSGWMPDFIERATVYELWTVDDTMQNVPFDNKETIAEHNDLIKGINISVNNLENHPKHIKNHRDYILTLDVLKDKEIIEELERHIGFHERLPQKTRIRKYPFGRKIVFTANHILEDNKNPIAEEMEIGIDFRDLLIKWDYDPVDDEYWGKSGVADLFDPQDALNHRKNAITQMINRLNHGVKKIRENAYAQLKDNPEMFANLIASVLPVRNPDDVTIDYGPNFPSQIFDDLIHSDTFMDRLMDHTDITSGNFPKGSPAGVTVDTLLKEGLKPTNLVLSNYGEALKEMGRVLMILMVEFIPPHLKFRMIDKKRNWQFIKWEDAKQYAGYFDIDIDIDQMLATTRKERLEEAILLGKEGYYDRTAVLERVDDPDKFEIIQRMGEIPILSKEVEEQTKAANFWEGQFDNLAQNYNRLSIEIDKLKMVIKEFKGNGKPAKQNA